MAAIEIKKDYEGFEGKKLMRKKKEKKNLKIKKTNIRGDMNRIKKQISQLWQRLKTIKTLNH